MQLKTGYPNLDHRFVEAISVLSQPLQGSARDKVKLVDLIVLERIGEVRHSQLCLVMDATASPGCQAVHIGAHTLKLSRKYHSS